MGLETVVIKIVGDTKQLDATIDKLEKVGIVDKKNAKVFRQTSKEFQTQQEESQKSVSSLSKSIGTLGVALAGAFTVRALINFTKELLTTATQMEAFEKRAKTVFGNSIKFVEEFAQRNAEALGLTQNEFLGAAAAIGDVIIPLGLSRQRAAEMSTELTKLGGALKQFTGDQRSASEIASIAARALTGETEGLKGLGVVVSQNTAEFRELVKAKIRDKGVTELQGKALAIYDTILQRSNDALTSFENDTGSLIRQQAILGAQWRELKEELATGLIPIFSNLVSSASEVLKAFKILQAVGFGDPAKVAQRVAALKKENAAISQQEEIVNELSKQIGILNKALEKEGDQTKTGVALKKQIAFLDEKLIGLKSKLNEETEQGNKADEEQIRNVFFLKGLIGLLVKEREKQETSLERVADINKELVPLQKEYNDLLGKTTDETLKLALAWDSFVKKIQSGAPFVSKEFKKAMELIRAQMADVGVLFSGEDEEDIVEDADFLIQKFRETIEGRRQLSEIAFKSEEISQAEHNANLKQLDDELKEAKIANIQELLQLTAFSADKIFGIISNLNQNQLIDLDNRITKEERELQKSFDNKLITEEQFTAAQKANRDRADRERAQLLTKQAENDKAAKIIAATINTAVAVTAAIAEAGPVAGIVLGVLVGALGAAEIATIAAQPIPEFHKGKKAELSSDEIAATIRKDEYVIHPKASKDHNRALDAMLDGKFKEFVYHEYQKPIIQQYSKQGDYIPYDDWQHKKNQRSQIELLKSNNILLRQMGQKYNSRRYWNG